MEVPGRVAAALDIPLVANVSSATCEGRTLVAERSGDGVREVVEADLPAMVSADKSLNKPRYPNLPSIMKAKKKPVEVIPIATALGAAPSASRRVVSIQLPEAKGPCRFLEGPPQQAAAELARILRDEVGVLH
jgi:electron transfer flavoprotein beta subunit